MDTLIDSLSDKWAEVDAANRSDGYKEYHVVRNHKQLDATTMGYMIAEEDGDPKSVEIKFCKDNKDPIKNIGLVELKLDPEEKNIVGIDTGCDCVEFKG